MGCHFMVHITFHCGLPIDAREDLFDGSPIGFVNLPNHLLTLHNGRDLVLPH